MSSTKTHVVLFVISMIWFIILIHNGAALELRGSDCSNTTTFKANSTYQINLNRLLSFLISNSSSFSTGFYYTSVGQEPGSQVHGSFLCRGDASPSVCEDCVKTAVKKSTEELCRVEKVAVIWYDLCMLRYSNASFIRQVDELPSYSLYNIANISSNSPEKFEEVLGNNMKELVARASEAPIGAKKFATKEFNFSNQLYSVYNLVQCTPDLSSLDCNMCLQKQVNYLPSCCGGKQGGNVLGPSCNLRYETYQFYTIQASPPPLPHSKGKGQVSSTTIIAICIPIAFALLLFPVGYYFLKKRVKHSRNIEEDENASNEIATAESLQFDMATILAATCNFSIDNKLGEGGFGEVFKGVLPNGQEVAVKRLSRGSGQGAREFKNEATLVAKLQHRNLVKILGFCAEGKENILVYEFVSNKSLDFFLSEDAEKRAQFDWSRRYKIICGIARGILYLHEDAPLKIIHLDLKPSNILLDGEMKPKISDFGMARILGIDQTQGIASKIAGTFGYMAPEYAYNGQFTVKSDVYSFGVLILEIITGKKNNYMPQSESFEYLLTYVWKHWRDGTPMELLHSNLRGSCSRDEVIKCVHIGLLCVQEDPVYRPTMNSILLMLNSNSVSLPNPAKPPILFHSQIDRSLPSIILESKESSTVNEMSISEMSPR